MLESRRRLLNAGLVGILLLTCGLLLTTLFLLETPFVGFNALVTAGVLLAYALSAIGTLNHAPSAFAIGVLVGASLLVLVLSLQGAVYWGLVAAAEDVGLGSPSAVAALLQLLIFLLQLAVTWSIVRAKEDVIDTYAAYEFIPDVVYADRGSLSAASPINYQAAAPTADI